MNVVTRRAMLGITALAVCSALGCISTARAADDTIAIIQPTPTPVHTVRTRTRRNSGRRPLRRAPVQAHARRAAPRPSAPMLMKLLVSPDAPGAFRSISAALDRARAGAHITIRPGVYTDSLVLHRPVTLTGDGPRDHIIIQSARGSCLNMRAEKATVTGLTFQALPNVSNLTYYAVDIGLGHLEMTDCDITSASLACVGIHGHYATPILRHCTIHDGQRSGVYVYDDGHGLLEDCDISGNYPAGIAVGANGSPTVRRCTIRNGKHYGVFIFANGQGLFDTCDISDNDASQVNLVGTANPQFAHGKIHNGRGNGVVTSDEATGHFSDCEITGNSGRDVESAERTHPIFDRCIFSDKKQGASL